MSRHVLDVLKKRGIVVGYNIQTAVEIITGLIIHPEVTKEESDNRHLEPMAKAAKSKLGVEKLTVLVDAGISMVSN